MAARPWRLQRGLGTGPPLTCCCCEERSEERSELQKKFIDFMVSETAADLYAVELCAKVSSPFLTSIISLSASLIFLALLDDLVFDLDLDCDEERGKNGVSGEPVTVTRKKVTDRALSPLTSRVCPRTPGPSRRRRRRSQIPQSSPAQQRLAFSAARWA